jgi:type I restriction-modification system DNA methylase subunit
MEEHTDDIKDGIDEVKDTVIEGFENLIGVIDVRTERIALNTNNLFNAICGTLEEPSLEAKLKRKIDEHAEEIQKLKKKLSKMDEKMYKVLTLLRSS